jgi:group I intron endonuclease
MDKVKTNKIYLHRNKINGKCYVGKTSQDVNRRWRKEDSSYKTYSQCAVFYKALQKYGWDAFETTILVELPLGSKVNQIESYYIAVYNSLVPNGYNIKEYDEFAKEIQSDETKKKIRDIKRGKSIDSPSWNRKEPKFIDGIEHRQCAKCCEYKPLEQFSVMKRKTQTSKEFPLNLDYYCKPCKRTYNKQYPYQRKPKEEVAKSYKERGKKSSKMMKDKFSTEEARRAKSLTYGGYKGVNPITGETITFECGHDLKKAGLPLPQVSNVLNTEKTAKGYKWTKSS